jgi:polyhydroxyalkanoate synthesis repressor PhaR
MQIIKKYANRKLYHTNRKQYITLEGIAALIQAGEQVQVLDNETGEDITSTILTQVVLQSRGGGDRLPTQVLTGLIRAGGDTIAGMRRSIVSAVGGTSLVDAEIKHRLDRLRDEGRIDVDELSRLESLLLHGHAEGGAPAEELPSHSDIARLHAQVDALSAAVDQLLSERDKRSPS